MDPDTVRRPAWQNGYAAGRFAGRITADDSDDADVLSPPHNISDTARDWRDGFNAGWDDGLARCPYTRDAVERIARQSLAYCSRIPTALPSEDDAMFYAAVLGASMLAIADTLFENPHTEYGDLMTAAITAAFEAAVMAHYERYPDAFESDPAKSTNC